MEIEKEKLRAEQIEQDKAKIKLSLQHLEKKEEEKALDISI